MIEDDISVIRHVSWVSTYVSEYRLAFSYKTCCATRL